MPTPAPCAGPRSSLTTAPYTPPTGHNQCIALTHGALPHLCHTHTARRVQRKKNPTIGFLYHALPVVGRLSLVLSDEGEFARLDTQTIYPDFNTNTRKSKKGGEGLSIFPKFAATQKSPMFLRFLFVYIDLGVFC